MEPLRIIPFFLLLVLLCTGLLAQRNTYRQGIVLEGGGSAVGWALSYEQSVVANSSFTWTARAGAGLSQMNLYLPIVTQVNFLSGEHHPVAGLSGTLRINTPDPYRFFDTRVSDTYLHLGVVLGYRWQSRRNRLFAQLHIVPGAQLDPTPNTVSSTDPIREIRGGAILGFKLNGR